MIEHAGKVLTHRMLLQEVWGRPTRASAVSSDVCRPTQKKLEKDPARPRFILTDPGVGYRFCAEGDPSPKV
jgi:two-component system, OmpR family, KDP operon response regulator KdpE